MKLRRNHVCRERCVFIPQPYHKFARIFLQITTSQDPSYQVSPQVHHQSSSYIIFLSMTMKFSQRLEIYLTKLVVGPSAKVYSTFYLRS